MLVAFMSGDLSAMRLSSDVFGIISKFKTPEIIAALAGAGLAYTIVAREEPVILGIAGAVPIGNGKIAEVFVISSEDRYSHQVEFAKSVWRILEKARRRFERVEAVSEDTTELNRWLTWLRFQRIGFADGGMIRWGIAGIKGDAA